MDCHVIVRNDGKNELKQIEFTEQLFVNENIPWIHLKLESRQNLNELPQNRYLTEELIARLQQPGKSFLVERIGEVRVLDCNISYSLSKESSDYLTFVFLPNLALTVGTLNTLPDNLEPRQIIDPNREYDANLIVLTLFRRMLDLNTSLANKFTKRVDSILKKSISKSFETPTTELEILHSEAIDLNELFEDQLTTIRLLPMNIESTDTQTISFLDRIEKSMEYLVSITERSQGKLDYILQRYASVLQQKANARLNTLTIVQAIFVPLTFIAGIYGMNFVNIPELEWESGYFYAWGLMSLIGIGSLLLFYKNGWFKSN